jgi:hypothetical protein
MLHDQIDNAEFQRPGWEHRARARMDDWWTVAGGRPAINGRAPCDRRGSPAKHATTSLTQATVLMDQSPDPSVPATTAAATEELPP